MTKWITEYLGKNYTDNTDISKKLSVLSAPIIKTPQKIHTNKIKKTHNDNSFNNIYLISNLSSSDKTCTDNTDKNWDALVKEAVSDRIKSIDILETFIEIAGKKNIELLNDDKKWLKKICNGVPSLKLLHLLEQYIVHWLSSMDSEAIPYKKQNVGRFAANSFLREMLHDQI